MGKQQVTQLTFFDYVVGITIGSIAGTLSVQVNKNTMAILVGMVTWTVLAILLTVIGVHNVWVHEVVDRKAMVVVENGKILEDNIKRIRIPTDKLISGLRTQGVFNMADVHDVTEISLTQLDTKGNLYVDLKGDRPYYLISTTN